MLGLDEGCIFSENGGMHLIVVRRDVYFGGQTGNMCRSKEGLHVEVVRGDACVWGCEGCIWLRWGGMHVFVANRDGRM